MKRALVRSIAAPTGLGTDGRDLLWDNSQGETREHDNKAYRGYESARVLLRRIGTTNYLHPEAFVRIVGSDGEVVPQAIERAVKMGSPI